MAVIDSTETRLDRSSNDSGGAGTLGGAHWANWVVDGEFNSIYDDVSEVDSVNGATFYACLYISNNNSSIVWQDVKLWVNANTPSPDSHIRLALGTAGLNAEEQAISDSKTAPVGVTWIDAVDQANALNFGDIPANQSYALWIELAILPGATRTILDNFTLESTGGSATV